MKCTGSYKKIYPSCTAHPLQTPRILNSSHLKSHASEANDLKITTISVASQNHY